MANGSSRVLPMILSLALGFVVGWVLHSQPPPPPPPPSPVPTTPPPTATITPKPVLVPGHHTIMVGPKAKDLTEEYAAVSKQKGHKVRWVAQDPDLTLTILFKVADFDPTAGGEPPFKGPKSVDQSYTCRPDKFCKSDQINDKLTPTDTHPYQYKYWQILFDNAGNEVDRADGMIIIQK